MIRILPLETDVTGLSHNEIVEKYDSVYGVKNIDGRTYAQIGFVELEV